MFSFMKLFGGRAGNSTQEAPTAKETDPAQAIPPTQFLRREAVFDRNNRLAGHFFYLQQSSLLADAPAEIQHQNDARLLAILVSSIEAWNAQPAFIPLGSEILDHAAIDRLPNHNLVLLIQLSANETNAGTLGVRLETLRKRGLSIGIFRQPRHPLFSLAAQYADIGVIDSASSDARAVREFSAAFRAAESAYPVKLLATDIDTQDDHRLCMQWHFDFFHGPFATSAPLRESTPADPHKIQLLHLFRLVQGDAETAEIAEAMKQDPLLTFRILRYLNSPALGLNHRVDSIGQALIILGRQRLSRWLSVLLFSVNEPNFADWMLVESALTRGRLMELLGPQVMPEQPSEALFLTGIFSCLDRLLHRPMAGIIDGLPLADDICSALLKREGPFAPLLDVAEASEAFDVPRMETTAATAGLAAADINRALLAATAWASEVTECWE